MVRGAGVRRREADVRARLADVIDPCSISVGVPLSILEMGLVVGVAVGVDQVVTVKLRLSSPGCMMGALLFEREIRTALRPLGWIEEVRVDIDDTASWSEQEIEPRSLRRLQAMRRQRESRSSRRSA